MTNVTVTAVVLLAATLGGCMVVPVSPGVYAASPGYYAPAPAHYAPSVYYGPPIGVGIYAPWRGYGRGYGRR